MELWQTDEETDLVVNFVQVLHIEECTDNSIVSAILSNHGPTEKSTTVVHLRDEMVACSESYESIVGAAAMEILTPVSDEQVIEGYKNGILSNQNK